MDLAGLVALVSSILVNIGLAYRLFRRTNTESAGATAEREAEKEENASAGWKAFAGGLAERLKEAEERVVSADRRADKAVGREMKCQTEAARLTEQNRQQAGKIVQLETGYRALKAELREHGLRTDSSEFPTPPEPNGREST